MKFFRRYCRSLFFACALLSIVALKPSHAQCVQGKIWQLKGITYLGDSTIGLVSESNSQQFCSFSIKGKNTHGLLYAFPKSDSLDASSIAPEGGIRISLKSLSPGKQIFTIYELIENSYKNCLSTVEISDFGTSKGLCTWKWGKKYGTRGNVEFCCLDAGPSAISPLLSKSHFGKAFNNPKQYEKAWSKTADSVKKANKDGDYRYEYTRSQALTFLSSKVFGFANAEYSFQGGEHGYWSLQFYTIDLNTNKIIGLHQLIKEEAREKLAEVLCKKACEKLDLKDAKDLSFLGLSFDANDLAKGDFYLCPYGIVFSQNCSSYSSFEYTGFEISLSWAEAKEYLTTFAINLLN